MKADLNNAEIDELDALLQQGPSALEPLDVVTLDGYLCAVAVQPRIVSTEQWLPRALDTDGSRWPPAGLDPAWLSRVQGLMQRRFEALVRGLSEDGVFDPVVSDMAAGAGHSNEVAEAAGAAEADGLAESSAIGTDRQGAEAASKGDGTQNADDPMKDVPAHSRALVHWASGFLYGCEVHEGLLEHPDDGVHLALSRILRHLPPESDEDRELVATLDREHPLRDEHHAIEDTVLAAVDLWDLTVRDRMAVRTVQRETPKVGRNDPCPCGSGRKFKQCHGKS